MTDHLRH